MHVKNLSVVFQDFKLFGYTIDDNIAFGNMDKKLDDNVYMVSGMQQVIRLVGLPIARSKD